MTFLAFLSFCCLLLANAFHFLNGPGQLLISKDKQSSENLILVFLTPNQKSIIFICRRSDGCFQPKNFNIFFHMYFN